MSRRLTPVEVIPRRGESSHVTWARVGPWLGALAASVTIALVGWSLRQAVENGREISIVRAELAALRGEVGSREAEHASHVTRGEMAEIVKRLDATLLALRDELRDQRRRR